jgi:hypothetical protein
MRATVAIASTREKPKDSERLPILRIYETREGEYMFLENSVITNAITESLEKMKLEQLSLVLIEVQVVPISSRKRRVTRSRNNIRN